jgi:hypothetical protein
MANNGSSENNTYISTVLVRDIIFGENFAWCGGPIIVVQCENATLIKKKIKFFSYLREIQNGTVYD